MLMYTVARLQGRRRAPCKGSPANQTPPETASAPGGVSFTFEVTRNMERRRDVQRAGRPEIT